MTLLEKSLASVILIALLAWGVSTAIEERRSSVAVENQPSPLVDQNHIVKGVWHVIEMDNETIADYVVVKLISDPQVGEASPNITHAIARPEEGLELGDEVIVWEIKIGRESPYQLARHARR